MKEQAAGLTREYDRLLEEHSKAQVGGEGRVYYLKTPSQEVPIWRTSSFFFRIFNHFTTVCLNSNKICLMKILKKLLNQWIFIQNKGKLSVQFAMIML